MRTEQVTARCQDCDWEKSGDLFLHDKTEYTMEGGLIEECRKHHVLTGIHIYHNRFNLFIDGQMYGFAAVSSQVQTGFLDKSPIIID